MKTASTLSYSNLPAGDRYDFSSAGERGDFYSQMILYGRKYTFYIIEVEYWMQGPDSVDIKVYRSYEEHVEDYSTTPPADYNDTSKRFEDCYGIQFNSTDKYIDVTPGCDRMIGSLDYTPSVSNYDFPVRDLVTFDEFKYPKKNLYANPSYSLLKIFSNGFTNIPNTFSKYGYQLTPGKFMRSFFNGLNPQKSMTSIFVFTHNSEESFIDRTYELKFSISRDGVSDANSR